VTNHVSPATPFINLAKNEINWKKVEGAVAYNVIKKGKAISKISETNFTISNDGYAEYQVIAIDEKGFESFASEPLVVAGDKLVHIYQVENFAPKASYSYKGFSGVGFVETAKEVNKIVTIPITISEPGLYSMDVRYANGNGPVNTENKCAIRTLKINGSHQGTLVFPQRGKEEWSNWGFSNTVRYNFKKGSYNITIALEDHDDNMNFDINQAMLDYVRLTKL
jgi:hypothetical protein